MTKGLEILKDALGRGYWVDPIQGVIHSLKGPMKSCSDSNGRPYVTLRDRTGRQSIIHIHKAVAYCIYGDEAFSGRMWVVRHLDDNVWNNDFRNLAMGTPSQNQMDISVTRRRQRRIDGQRNLGANRRHEIALKISIPRREASDEQVREIRRLAGTSDRPSWPSVAKGMNLPAYTVWRIAKGLIYKEVPA